MLLEFRRLQREKSGNFGIMTALIFPVMLVAAGSAIDLANALLTKTQLQGAADSAVLSAISPASEAIADALEHNIEGEIPKAKLTAERFFKVNAVGTGASITRQEAHVQRSSKTLTSSLTFSARVGTSFMKLAGFDHIDVAGYSEATTTTADFFDFHILMDNSPSMGIGATVGDIGKMQAGLRCAFACHNLQSSNENTYQWAKARNITLRVDVVSMGLAAMIERAKATSSYPSQYRMSLYTFGKRAEEEGLTQVTSMTYDLKEVASAAEDVKLMSIPRWYYKNHLLTDFDDTLKKLRGKIAAQQSNGRQKILLLITDGMNDSYKTSAECRYKKYDQNTCWQPIDSRFCEQIKAEDTRIAVLYTTFWPLESNADYNTYIKPWQSDIAKSAQQCASQGLFFEVSPTDGIEKAMNSLFDKVVSNVVLTQ